MAASLFLLRQVPEEQVESLLSSFQAAGVARKSHLISGKKIAYAVGQASLRRRPQRLLRTLRTTQMRNSLGSIR